MNGCVDGCACATGNRITPPARALIWGDSAPSKTVFVVAELLGGVIYFEDIEEGFEFDRPGPDGAIAEQGRNQYALRHLLTQLECHL